MMENRIIGKDLICLKDLSKEQIQDLFKLTEKVKNKRKKMTEKLKNCSIGMLFTKPSNRTRVSFEVGIVELGGYPIYLGPKEIRLGERETIKDAAKVLSRYVDALVIRTFSHNDVIELAKHADVPVINGLTDLFHPCQILADMFTIEEKMGLDNKKIVYVGDGNNIVHSWLYGSAKMGLHFVVSTPEKYKPDPYIFNNAVKMGNETGAKIEYIHDPKQAVEGADVIYTDVWASMGKESETEQRKKDFEPYQVNEELASLANDNYLFMHCLPAHRGDEVTDAVIDGVNSVVIDEAENRLHVQKAVLLSLM